MGLVAGFVDYTATVAPRVGAPEVWAVAATAAEAVLGILLLVGCWWRWVGKAAAGLLFVYTVQMSLTVGVGRMLGYAVPLLVGGALLGSARGDRPSTGRSRSGPAATVTVAPPPTAAPDDVGTRTSDAADRR